jgi:hypothetical protein
MQSVLAFEFHFNSFVSLLLGNSIIGLLQLHEEVWREKFLVYLEGSLYHEYTFLVEKSKDLTPKCELPQQLDI